MDEIATFYIEVSGAMGIGGSVGSGSSRLSRWLRRLLANRRYRENRLPWVIGEPCIQGRGATSLFGSTDNIVSNARKSGHQMNIQSFRACLFDVNDS